MASTRVICIGIIAGESAHENHYDSNTRGESSWSMFQLNRAGGLGNVFERQTGLDVRNPKSIPAIADFVARHIASGKSLYPWRGFHGPRNWDNHWGNIGYSPEHKSFAPPPKRHAPISHRECALPRWARDRAKHGSPYRSRRTTPDERAFSRRFARMDAPRFRLNDDLMRNIALAILSFARGFCTRNIGSTKPLGAL